MHCIELPECDGSALYFARMDFGIKMIRTTLITTFGYSCILVSMLLHPTKRYLKTLNHIFYLLEVCLGDVGTVS